MADRALFNELIAYHKGISELPSPDHYVLLAAHDGLTYLHDRFDYCPVINLAGLRGRGKTRTAKGMTYVSYRGIETTSVTEAHILRWAEYMGATLFFDVRDFSHKVQKSGAEDIFLKRFERGATVPRVLNYERGPFQDTRNFRVYGPTIIASNEPLSDLMESRAITIVMSESSMAFPTNVRPEAGLPYREALVAFRARHMLDHQMPVMPKPSSGRLGDVLQPVASIIALMAPGYLGNLRRLTHRLEQERLADRSLSVEARIVLAVEKAALSNTTGKLSVSEIHQQIVGGWVPFQIGLESLGRRLSSLGFARTRMTGGPAAVIYDQAKIDRLKRELGVG